MLVRLGFAVLTAVLVTAAKIVTARAVNSYLDKDTENEVKPS